MEKASPSSSCPSSPTGPRASSIDNKKANIDPEKNIDGSTDEPVVNYRGIWAMPYIIGNETFEKTGTFGASQNLVVYLSLVFNMNSVRVTRIHNVFTGTTNLMPLLGGFLSDTYFGRYTTIAIGCVASFLGMALLMLTAAVSSLHPPHCVRGLHTVCEGPTSSQLAFLFAAFAFMIIGAAGIRPCNLAFGADQFNPNTKSGKRGAASFFNWYYFTSALGSMLALTVIVYVQTDISWAIGLAIPAILMFIATVVFFLGTRIYVMVKPEGSPLTGMAQVIVAAIRKFRKKLPDDSLSLHRYIAPKSTNSKLSHTSQFRFLDKAAIVTDEDEINEDGSPKNPWRLCGVQQVEEFKCMMKILPIWAASIIYNVPFAQQQTYAVFQAMQSDRRLGDSNFHIPPATIVVISMLALIIWVPIYDQLIVPFLQKITKKEGGITVLQRMGIGMVLSVLCSVVSGLVEVKRKHIADTQPTLGIARTGGAISAMSVMWLVPQLAICGVSEAFNYIAQVELYYSQCPENMRSIAGAIFWASLGIANYISSFLISIVHNKTSKTNTGDWLPNDLNKGKLDYFYYLIAIMGAVNFVYFVLASWWFNYKAIGGKDGGAMEITKVANESNHKNIMYGRVEVGAQSPPHRMHS